MNDFPPELLNAPVVFGLQAQGHIATIENMLKEGKSWEEIGSAIGWCYETAEKHYFKFKIKQLEIREKEIDALLGEGKDWDFISNLLNWHPNISRFGIETCFALMKSERKLKIQKELGKAFILIDEKDYYRILTPFSFNDGDHISAVLKDGNLSDQGHVMMLLDFRNKNMTEEGVAKILAKYSGQLINGVIVFDTDLGIAERLCHYIQAVLEIHNK